MNTFTIKDLELLTGIKAHTIRIWEQRYSFMKPNRTATNIRYYNASELKSLLNICLLNKHGVKVSDIDEMDESTIQNRVLSIKTVNAREERIFNELVMSMIDMQVEAFEKLINGYTQEQGVDKALNDLIVPFTERIGIFWLNRRDTKPQQKLISNVIRQKFLYAINGLDATIQKDKSIVLFLPEGEHYELGLLHLAYLVKRSGMNAIYLGANLPLTDLLSVTKSKSPHCVITHLNAHNSSFEKFLPKYQQQLPDIPLIVATNSIQSIFKKSPPSVVREMPLNDMPSSLGLKDKRIKGL